MAFRKVLFFALAIASASAAPQNIIRVPFGSLPIGAVPLTNQAAFNQVAHPHVLHHPHLAGFRTIAAAAPQVVAVAPAVVEAKTEIVDIDPSYRFGYSVSDAKTGDSKTREETRDGDVVTGSYSVADPDGRIRRVTYTADAVNGFQAVVTYDGVAGPPAISIAAPVAAPVVTEVREGRAEEAPVAPADTSVLQAVRTVPAASPLLAQHFAHAQPTVVTHNAAHALHNTVAVPHAFHQNVAPTFLRNADGSISQAGFHQNVHQNVAPTFLRNADGSISQAGFHQNVAPTATFLRNADGTISQVANFNQFQGLQTVPLNSGLLRAFPNQHFAGQHLIQHAY